MFGLSVKPEHPPTIAKTHIWDFAYYTVLHSHKLYDICHKQSEGAFFYLTGSVKKSCD